MVDGGWGVMFDAPAQHVCVSLMDVYDSCSLVLTVMVMIMFMVVRAPTVNYVGGG